MPSDRTIDLTNHRKVAVACKNYVDKSINNLRWELGTYDLGVDTVNGTTMLLPSPSGTIQATMVRIDGASEVSENLIVLNDVAETTTNGITWKIQNGIIYLNGTNTSSSTIYISINQTTRVENGQTYYFYIGGIVTGISVIYLSNRGDWTAEPTFYNKNNNYKTMTASGNLKFEISVSGSATVNTQLKPMLVKGSTAPTEFKVGFSGIHNFEWTGIEIKDSNDTTQETISVDLSTILYNGNPLFEENSLKAVGTAKDYITPYKAHKQMGYIDLGSLDWTLRNLTDVNCFSSTDLINYKFSTDVNVLIDNYNYEGTVSGYSQMNNKLDKSLCLFYQGGSTGRSIYINDANYTTAEAFKTAMSGVYLVYELATPIEADIDLSQLVKFEAYSNGSITLVNTNNQDTTSTFKYLKEVAK